MSTCMIVVCHKVFGMLHLEEPLVEAKHDVLK